MLEYIKILNETRKIEDVFYEVKYNLDYDKYTSLRLIASLKNHALSVCDDVLFEEVLELEKIAGVYGPFPQVSLSSEPGDEWNLPLLPGDLPRPPLKTKREPTRLQLVDGYKGKMAQFLQLTYEGKWYKPIDISKPLAQSDVNYWFGIILNGYNFDAQSGALAQLYGKGNWEELAREIYALSSTEHKKRIGVKS